MKTEKLAAELARPADEVAPVLLGWTLSSTRPEGTVTVELTEVEAYLGGEDPASHAYRGRTARNEVMFGAAGHLYTYRSYGIHWCCNVVTGTDGIASAVLLRAGRVIEGLELARARRGPDVAERALARGPGCLAQALGLTGEDYGADLTGDGCVRLRRGTCVEPARIASGSRVGVRLAADVALRFWIDGEPTVSAYRRSPRAQ
ncbi:DNA-3-methyladenine glycosylase [Nocardioidaceae bacterium SCSIO 66511]|nr:DNA-3-methyladenine glycosylase [Nocardioidaceae bacterium SCSIO 66511]